MPLLQITMDGRAFLSLPIAATTTMGFTIDGQPVFALPLSQSFQQQNQQPRSSATSVTTTHPTSFASVVSPVQRLAVEDEEQEVAARNSVSPPESLLLAEEKGDEEHQHPAEATTVNKNEACSHDSTHASKKLKTARLDSNDDDDSRSTSSSVTEDPNLSADNLKNDSLGLTNDHVEHPVLPIQVVVDAKKLKQNSDTVAVHERVSPPKELKLATPNEEHAQDESVADLASHIMDDLSEASNREVKNEDHEPFASNDGDSFHDESAAAASTTPQWMIDTPPDAGLFNPDGTVVQQQFENSGVCYAPRQTWSQEETKALLDGIKLFRGLRCWERIKAGPGSFILRNKSPKMLLSKCRALRNKSRRESLAQQAIRGRYR